MANIDGKIAAILSPAKVVINKGSKDGVEEGDYFLIYSELGPFSDPDTKQNLGSTKQIWGKVGVSIVEKRFCIAETETRLRNPFWESGALAALFGTTREQIRLPVNEGQILKGLEKIEVGFPARLVKAAEYSEEEGDEPEELPAVQPSLLGPASYRRKHGADTWHFCSNCSNWPTSDFDTQPAKPSSGEFCNECETKVSSHTCQ
jgi:hypothetical protein